MQLLIDENFDHRILRGLTVRLPGLDYVAAQDIGLQGAQDPSLLEWGARQNRILVTHDVNTIPKYAYERIVADQPMPGVIVVPESLDIGAAIEELIIVVECSQQSEWADQVIHLPL